MKIEEMRKIAEQRTKGKWTLDHKDRYVATPIVDGDWDWVTGDMKFDDGYSASEDEDLRGKNVENNCRFIALAANTYDALLDIAEKAKEAIKHIEEEHPTAAGLILINSLKKLEEL